METLGSAARPISHVKMFAFVRHDRHGVVGEMRAYISSASSALALDGTVGLVAALRNVLLLIVATEAGKFAHANFYFVITYRLSW